MVDTASLPSDYVRAAVAAAGGHRSRHEIVVAFCAGPDRFISAPDLHLRMRDAGSRVALSTVYQALRALAASGFAHSIHDDENGTLFVLRRRPGEDVARCRHCGAAARFVRSTESLTRAVSDETGFDEMTCELRGTGRCPRCQRVPHRPGPGDA